MHVFKCFFRDLLMTNEVKFLKNLVDKIQGLGFKGWGIERLCPKSERKNKTFSMYNITLIGPSGARYEFGQHEEEDTYSGFDEELQCEMDSSKEIFSIVEKAYKARA